MPGRTIAIGDIHGCSRALAAVLQAVAPSAGDTLVVLGDVVDRGPDTRGSIERLLALGGRCRLVTILGNHEQMLLEILHDGADPGPWLMYGGQETLDSYGPDADPQDLPEEHVRFLRGCVDYHETEGHFFVHASYLPHLPLAEQPDYVLRWESLRDGVPPAHDSGKVAIVGHTSQKTGEVLDAGHLKCVDTFCYGGGWLTALDVDSGRLWQADREGRLRDGA